MGIDLIAILCFYVTAYYNLQYQLKQGEEIFYIILSTTFLTLSILFYSLSLINPGYVAKREDFIVLLENMLEERFHLDYVCIQCENLRPENTRHCNYCNKCVEGFDHHCTFINNCVGYRNHKFFFLFLICFSILMLALICHSIYSLLMLIVDDTIST